MTRRSVVVILTLVLFCLVNLGVNATVHYQYQGCYNDSEPRAMYKNVSAYLFPTYSCYLICGGNGYSFFGLENGGECYCGDSTYNKYGRSEGCNMNCPSGEICGGLWTLSVYSVVETPAITYYWPIGSNYLVNSIGTTTNSVNFGDSSSQLDLDRFGGSTGAINLYNTPVTINNGFTLAASSTITLWFQRKSYTPYAPIIDCSDGSKNFTIFISNNIYGFPLIVMNNEWQFQSSYSIDNNTWYHFALSFNQNNNSLMYINGQNIGSRAKYDYPPLSFQSCSLGRMINGSYPADILLDDIKIFNKTLSQQEIFYDMDPIENVLTQNISQASLTVAIGFIARVGLLNMTTGSILGSKITMPECFNQMTSLVFVNVSVIAGSCSDRYVYFWDSQFNFIKTMDVEAGSGVDTVVVVSPGVLASKSKAGTVKLWKWESSMLVTNISLSNGVTAFTQERLCAWNASAVYMYQDFNLISTLPISASLVKQVSDQLLAYTSGSTISICLISNSSCFLSQSFPDTISSLQIYSEQIVVAIDKSGNIGSWNWQTGQLIKTSTGFAFAGTELLISSSSYIIGISNIFSLGSTVACWILDSNNNPTLIWEEFNGLIPVSIFPYDSMISDPKVYVYYQDNYGTSLKELAVNRSTPNSFTVSVLFFSPVDYSITYQWTVTQSVMIGGTAYNYGSFQTTNPTRSQQSFVLPRNALDYGTYQVEIAVQILVPLLSKNLTVKRSVNLSIVPAGITVMSLPNNINSLNVGKAQGLTLSPAKYSIDSDQLINITSLSFKFYCHAVDQTLNGQNYLLITGSVNYDLGTNLTTNTCFNDSGSFELRDSDNELYIKPGSFHNLITKNYQFIVTTTTQYATYYQIVNVFGSDQDQLIQPVIKPRLSTLLVPYLNNLIVGASSDLILQSTYIGNASNVSSLVYAWRVNSWSDGHWMSLTSSLVSGINTNEITISSDFFTLQNNTKSWMVGLTLNQTISSVAYKSETSIILNRNDVPYNGLCQVSPSRGKALTTLFTISCQDWRDSDGIVVDYAFYASDEELSVSLGRDSSGNLTTYLPVSSSLSLVVYVYDDLNAISVYSLTTSVVVNAPDSNTTLQEQQQLLALSTPGSPGLQYSSLADLSTYTMAYTTSIYKLAEQQNQTQDSIKTQQKVNEYLVNQISMFNITDIDSIEMASSALAIVTSNTEMINSATATKIADLCNQMATNLQLSGETSDLTQLTTTINTIFDASTNSLQSLNTENSSSTSIDLESIATERDTLDTLTNVIAYRLPVGSSFTMSSESMDMTVTRSRLISTNTTISLGDSQMTYNNACQLINQSDCSTTVLITQVYARPESLNLYPSLNTVGSRSISVSFFDDQMSSISVNSYSPGFFFRIKRDSSSSKSFVSFNTNQKTVGVRNQFQSFLIEANTNASVTIEIKPNDTAYLVGVKYGESFVINSSVQIYDKFRVFCSLDLTSEDGSWFYRLFASNPNYTSKIGYGLRELTENETIQYCSGTTTTQPATLPVLVDDYDFSSLISSSFSVRVYASSCYFVDETKANYSTRGTRVLEDSNMAFTHCVSTHLTEFAGGLVVLPSTIDFNNVWSKADFTQNLTIYLTVIIISSLYILMFVWCRYIDWTDEKKRAVYCLDDNSPLDKYFYEIIVFTGQRRNAGTKSKVSFVMGGMDSDSPVRSLQVKKQKILERGSVNSFIMSTEESIGDLNYIKIWHDNSGKGRYASWFLKFLIVHDLQTRDKFYFICNDWLAVDKSDGQVERFLPVAMGKQKTELKYLMEKQTKERLSDGHLWYSILARPSESSFSRSDRLTCAFVLLCLTMLMNIMYYDVAKSSSSSTNELVIGPFALSQTQIVIGVITNLVIFPPSFLLLQMFRRSRRRTTRTMKLRKQIEDIKFKNSAGQPEVIANTNMEKEIASVKLSKPKRRFTLPWWFKIITYLLSAAIVAVCLFFVLVKGISFGDDQCRRWLTSFLISILTSIFLTQPLQILLISVFIIILFRQDDGSNDSEYDPNDDGQPINKIYAPKRRKTSDTPMLARFDEQNEILLAQLKKKRDQENQASSLIKKTVIYAIFLTVLFQVSYSKTNPLSYRYQSQLQSLLLQNITRVKTAEQVFSWIYDEFAPAVFRTDWYNSQAMTGMSKYITDYTSVLVGNILLRQARVVTKTCSNSNSKLNEKNICYYDYSVGNYDHKNYGVQWTDAGSSSSSSLDQSVKDAFTYSSASSIDSKPYSGRYTNYLGGGYVFQMDKTTTNLTQIRQRLSDLETNSWVNQNTRAVFLEFTVYNVNLDLFSYCVILFEMLPTGSIVSSFMFEPISLYADESILILVFDIVYLFIMVFYILKEIKLMVKLGLSRYLSHWWSYLDWTLIAFSFTAFAMYLCRLYEKWGVSSKIKNSNGQIINFQTLNYWNGLMLVFLGFCCFAASLKLIKIFEFSRTIKMLMRVFRQCFMEMCAFIVIFLVLLLAFTQLMYLMVYDRNAQFQSFAISLVTGFLIMIGKFNVDSFSQDAGMILGPLVYSIFVVTMVMILLNMFITVITDSFSKIRKEMMELHGREDSLVIMFFKQKVVQPFKYVLNPKKRASLKNTGSGDYKDTLHTLEQKSMRLAHHIDVNTKEE